jgi:2-amino-4-hydroxy-6-hydroxymethyldihydropteridine diphosphokinase/dihydropteroate synthase
MKLFLGLGSNLGNRLENLRLAIKHLKPMLGDVETSLVYETKALLPDDAPNSWNMPYYNMVIVGETELPPKQVLQFIKEVERIMGRTEGKLWAPRVIDIDILLYGDTVLRRTDLVIPHPNMLNRGFVMLPLSQLSPQFMHPKKHKTITQLLKQLPEKERQFIRTLPLQPKLMAILNVSEQSFSGDGILTVEQAVTRGLELVEEGASIIDFGAQSTRPGAQLDSWKKQLKHLNPVLTELSKELKLRNKNVVFSIDTIHAEIVSGLLHVPNLKIINDVSGAYDIGMLRLVAESGLRYVLMHSLSVPADAALTLLPECNIAETITAWVKKKLSVLNSYGISEQKIIFDPGIGFGKTALQSLAILQSIRDFKELNLPLLLGHSRKSFLQNFTNVSTTERDFETAVLTALCADAVDIVRVHNVPMTARAIAMRELVKY